MIYTRRELGKLILTTLPVAGLMPREVFAGRQSKPNSKWAGVQVGMNVPYNFGSRDMPIDETLAKTVELGVSAVELRSQPVELAMGAPAGQRGQNAKAAAEALREWRLKADPSKASATRKKWDDAGVHIEVLKYDGIYGFTDPEMDYAFNLAKALGVRAISCELEVEGSKRVGQFADKHGMIVAYHGHTKTPPAMFETAFGYAKHNWANIDIGHFVAGNLGNVVDYIRQHHDRITHVHIKDRKAMVGTTEGPNTPFGEGDTPIKDVLRLIRDNKWPIQATIEFEYKVPEGSDRMKEIAKTIQYCKDALLS